MFVLLGLVGAVAPAARADTAPSFSVADVSMPKPTTANGTMVFVVSLTQQSKNITTVNYTTGDDSAVANRDYVPVTGSLSFAPGNATKQVSVTVKPNTLDSGNKRFRLVLTDASNAFVQRGTAYGYIIDNTPQPVITIGDTTVNAGNKQTTTATLPVTLNTASPNQVSVHYATANSGNVRAGYNYTQTSGTLTFAPGTTTQNISVPILGGVNYETAQAFYVNLGNANNATIYRGSGKVLIVDNDITPYLTVDDLAISKPSSGTANAPFVVHLVDPQTTPVTVDYDTQDGNAVAGTDYTAAHGTLTFPVGTTSQTVNVPVTGSTDNNPARYFYFNLSNVSAGASLFRNSASAEIVSAQGPAFLDIQDAGVVRSGSNTSLTAKVTLSPAQAGPVTVNYATQDGNAVQPTDYTQQSGTLTFPAGSTSQTITVQIPGTTSLRGDKSFYINLSNANGASVNRSQNYDAVLTAQPTPYFSVIGGDVLKPTSGTSTVLPFQITLSQTPVAPVSINYGTADGSAIAGTDYTSVTGTVNFAAGTTTLTQTVNVPVTASSLSGNDRYLYLNTGGLVNVAQAYDGGQNFGYILNHNVPPTITIGDSAQYRPSAGQGNAPILFTVNLSAPSVNPVSFQYYTNDGSAVANTDYTPVSATTVTIPAGQTKVTVQTTVLPSTTERATNYFYMYLQNVTNASLLQSYATGYITDESVTPYVTVNNPTVTPSKTANTTASFTVSLSAPSAGTVTVNYYTGNSSATDGTDFTGTSGTVTFNPGVTSQTVNVTVLPEPTMNSDRSFYLQLSSVVNAQYASQNYGYATIVNTNTFPGVYDADTQVVTTGAATTLTFPIKLTQASTNTVTVNYGTGDGNAVNGTDYTATSGTATFSPGTTVQNVTVPILASTSTSERYFYLYLSSPVNALQTADFYAVGRISPSPAATSYLAVNDLATQVSASATTANFTVSLTKAATAPITVRYSTGDNYAVDGTDYTGVRGTLTFPAGTTSQTVSVPVLPQKQSTGTRDFFLYLGSNTGPSAISRSRGQALLENPTPDARFAVGPAVSIARGSSGSQNVTFSVSLAPAQTVATKVDYQAQDGTAVQGNDYGNTQGTLTFAPGVTTQTITVPIYGTTAVTGTQYFSVQLFNPVGAGIVQDRQYAYLYGVNTDTVSGTVTDTSGNPVAGVTVTRSGNMEPNAVTTTAADGSYSFPNSAYGNYTITPSGAGRSYGPQTQTATLKGTGAFVTPPFVSWTGVGITGRLAKAGGISVVGQTVTLSGGALSSPVTTTTNSGGYYAFGSLAASSTAYVVTPSLTGFTSSSPANYSITVGSANSFNKSFLLS